MFTCIFATYIAPPLTTPYDGPYKVLSRSGRVFKLWWKARLRRWLQTGSNLRISTASSKTIAHSSTKRHLKHNLWLQSLRRKLVSLGLKLTWTRIRMHGLWHRNRKRFQQSLHDPTWLRHSRLNRRHFTKRHMPGRSLLLALPGRKGVSKRTHAYL